ncbi:MAG: hypothetical protein ABI852_01185 [Gemmatimonadaceae bacterium]
MFGVWFTFTLALPNGMSGMNMSGGSASMNMAMPMSTSDMDMAGMRMSSTRMSRTDTSTATMARMDKANTGDVAASSKAEQGAPVQPSGPQQCDQHDCCCSAVSPTMLAPVASLAWLPEHVINQDTPQSGDCVAHTDGQLLLPFANGPPQTVSA